MKNFVLLICFVCGVASSNFVFAQESPIQNLPSPNPTTSQLIEVNGNMVQAVNLQQPTSPPEPVTGSSSETAASASTSTVVSTSGEVEATSCNCQQGYVRSAAARTTHRVKHFVSSVKCRVRHMLRRC